MPTSLNNFWALLRPSLIHLLHILFERGALIILRAFQRDELKLFQFAKSVLGLLENLHASMQIN